MPVLGMISCFRLIGVIPMTFRQKAYLAACGIMSAPFALLAQEQASVDLSTAEDFADDLGDALSGFVTNHLTTNVKKILLVMVGLLLLYRLIRWGMRALGGR